jgi:hypothetical protein
VTLLVDQEVVRLQISVDVAELVEGIDGEDDLGDVEPSVVLGQSAHVVQQIAEVATGQIFLLLHIQ